MKIVTKIATKIAMIIISVIGIVLNLLVTAIALILDMIDSVRYERVAYDRTTEMWEFAKDYVKWVYNDEI